MRTTESIVAISLGPLNPEDMKRAKAEAKEIAAQSGRNWMEIYYERNLSDTSCHYEGNIPKDISYAELDQALDEIDEQFRMRLAGL